MRSKVNIDSNFSKTIVERVFDESEFMLRNNEILKTTALKFKVSITTVWVDMRKRLPLINPDQYKKISGLIYSHKKRQKGYRISGFNSIGDDQMKLYCGMRLGEREDLPPVKVTVNGKPLKHQMYHSPDGFNWGYGGSGPADLARSILWDFIGTEPTPGLYQDFKFHFVSGWKDVWEITSEEIQNWLDKRGKVIK